MKVVVPKNNAAIMVNKEPVLPLVVDESINTLKKEDSVTYSLRTDPTDADSPTYKMTVRVLNGSESTRVILRWKKDVIKVLHGLNVTTIENKYTMAETMMRDTPLMLFQGECNKLAREAYDAALAAAADDVARAAIRGNGVNRLTIVLTPTST